MRKKLSKKLIAIALVFSMLSGQFVSSMVNLSAQTTENSADYSDTTRVRSEETLDIDVSGVADLKSFSASPLYDVENNELLLPRLEGYGVEVFGSDNKATISLEGKVTRGIQTQVVKLLYKLTNKVDGTITTTETNATIKIPARESEVVEGSNQKPNVMPVLREWVGGEGYLDLNNARIVVGHSDFQKAAKTFQEDYLQLTGRVIEVISGTENDLRAGDIYLEKDPAENMLGNEGYYLEIGGSDATQEYVVIKAIHNTGALYGAISIMQILKQDIGRDNLPKGIVKDYPLHEQRGMMFDVARKWIPMEYLNDLAKQMSWYKLNMLSLHLSDNDIWNGLSTENGRNGDPEGWFRLESESHPELTQNSGGFDRKEYYTKEEFRNYQYSLMDLGIDVLPELDTPGHALAYTRAWGEDSQRGDNGKYLDAANPENLRKMKEVFAEYINGYNGGEPTFVGDYVNIGTDEYKTGVQAEKEAFRAYCDALLKYVRQLGKEPVFWGSLTENSGTTEVTTDATMFAWYKGYANAKQSLDAGYKIISMEDNEVYIVPGGGYYSQQFGQAEKLYNSWLVNNNSGWANNPAPDGHPNVKGGQFAVWNDFSGNGISVQDISYRIQHNMYVIAEKTWAGTQSQEEGHTYENRQSFASVLGDAPNADFLYKVDKEVVNNEILKLDDKLVNEVDTNTGATLGNSNNITENVAGKHENAIQLNGDESYIETDIKSTGFDWTLSMWINPNDDGILMEGKTGTLRLKDDKLQYNVEQYTHEFAENIANGEWTHITLTGTYEGVKLYVNGELSETLIGNPYPNYNYNSQCNSWNGSYPTGPNGRTQRYYQTLMLPMETIGSKSSAITAVIDELNIFNAVLSDEEIKKLAGLTVETPKVNVALDKTVTSGNHAGTLSADNAVDGELNPCWEFALNNTDANFIQIPLNEDEDVNKIVIKQKVWGGVNRIENFKVVAVNGDEETDIVEEQTFEPDLNGTNVAEQISIKTIILDEDVKADAIKIYLTPKAAGPDDLVNIREIEMYGTKDLVVEEKPKLNVALNKAVSAEYYHEASTEGDRSALNAVDGNIDSRWEFAPNNTSTNYILIPLNEDEDVNKIVIKQMVWGLEGTNRIKDFSVVKVNGSTETELVEKQLYTPDENGTNASEKMSIKTITLDKAVKADAIKIYLTPLKAGVDDLVNIREIEMYGNKLLDEEPVEPSDYTLIDHSTMRVSATDEHPNYGDFEGPARFAIDDKKNTYWHTNWNEVKGLPQSITLQLAQAQYIGKYSYLPRQTGTGGIITKYKLEVSLDNVHFTTVKEGDWVANSAEKIVEFTPTPAKYVRLTALEGNENHASASELNVYEKTVNTKEDLQTMLTSLESMLESNPIIEDSKQALEKAIETTKILLTGNPSEKEIKDAYKQLMQGVNELIYGGNTDKLLALYEANKDYKASDFAKDGYDKYVLTLEKAKAIIDSTELITQQKIDKAEKDLSDAVKELASLTTIKSWIAKAEAIDITDVSESTGNELKEKLDVLKALLNNDATTANQVDIATYRMQLAIDDLVASPKALKELIDSYVEADYTATSWKVFVPYLEEAKTILNDSPSIQQLTDARIKLISDANALVCNASEKSIEELTKLIKVAEELNASDYTEESWNEYMVLVNAGKALLEQPNDVTQEQVDKAIKDMKDYTLVSVVENKEVLKECIAEFKNKQELYTITSWNAFEKVIEQAEAVLEKGDNEDLIFMIETLNEEAKKLVLRGDTSVLKDLVAQYQVNEDNYTAESYDNFKKHLLLAKQAIKDNSDLSQEDIAQIARGLIGAYESLIKVEIPDVKPVPKPNDVETGDSTAKGWLMFTSIGALGLIFLIKRKQLLVKE